MDRRLFAKVFAAIGGAQGLSSAWAAKPRSTPPARPVSPPAPADVQGDAEQTAIYARNASFLGGPRYQIGLVVYPGMNLADLVGAMSVFECLIDKDIHLIWKNHDLVGLEGRAESSLIPVRPNSTFDTCPNQLDVLFVPGSVAGSFTMMEDDHMMRFLAFHGQRARFVTSVSSGALLLAAAGALKGFKATTHWPLRDVLKGLGVPLGKGRVVVDGNRITGTGPSAGIDLGLEVVARLKDKAFAQAVQLLLEYDPAPPFRAGSPDKAPAPVRQFLLDLYGQIVRDGLRVAARLTSRTPAP